MDTSPFSTSTDDNWVSRAGGLPEYIRGVAHALIRTGRARDESHAIKIAVGVIRDWAEGRTSNGKGHVHPQVQAAAAAALADWEAKRAKSRSSSHANDQEAVELAGAFNSALHPRVPSGQTGGGRFGSAPAGAAKTTATAVKPKAAAAPAKKTSPAASAKAQAAAKAAADRQALQAKRAKLHSQADADRAKAKAILGQIRAINKEIATGKAQAAAAAKAAKSKKTTAKKSAAAGTKASTKAAAVKKKTAKKKAAKKLTVPQLRAKRATLRTQATSLMSRAKALDAQAAHLKLANDDSEAVELAMMTKTARVRGPGDVSCKRTGPGEVTVTHKPTGMKIGKLTPVQHGSWQGTHATGKATPASGSMAGALSGLIGVHNKIAASVPSAEPAASVHAMAAHEAAMELAGALPYTSAATSSDGPRVTTMGGALNATAKTAKAKASVPDRVQVIYRKLIAKGMKPAQAMALAKRAASMHAKAAAGPKASAASRAA